MSRRCHHGVRRHGRPNRPPEWRPAAPAAVDPVPPVAVDPVPPSPVEPVRPAVLERAVVEGAARSIAPPVAGPVERVVEPAGRADTSALVGAADSTPPVAGEPAGPVDFAGTCTAPQLRRFIKSRAYVPLHELRRRFAINGPDDDVTPVDLPGRRVFVGLPEREGRMLGELLRGGDIGYELSLDPISPIVVGVYPMRPVPRS